MKHKWFIFGVILKPYVKRKHHNNIIFCCTTCPLVHLTVNHRSGDVLEFNSLNELAEFCIRNKYVGKVWPKV